MNNKNYKCLLLNADFTPLSVIPWKRAIVWQIKYKNDKNYAIDIIDFYKNDYIIGTKNKKYPIPAVAITKKFFRSNKQNLTFSRKNIFIRDNYTCQYCGIKFDHNSLTYDHVIPKSIWDYNYSPTCWTNIVTACMACNRKKGNKTPKEAKMPLKNLPIVPSKSYKYLAVSQHLSTMKDRMPQEWKIYLPKSYL